MIFSSLVVLCNPPNLPFEAKYRPFAKECVRLFGVDDLRRSGYDISALLYRDRHKIVALIKRATLPGKFGEVNAGLLVRIGRDEWSVDARGNVSHGKMSHRLATKDFTALREMILEDLPDIRSERIEVDRLIIGKEP